MTINVLDLREILLNIASHSVEHFHQSGKYNDWKDKLLAMVTHAYRDKGNVRIILEDNCQFELPFHDMGNINTTHLFGIDEVIILSFYLKNKNNYKNALDLGANIGLHSLALSQLNIKVKAYEADPDTFNVFNTNIKNNDINNIYPINAAVASYGGVAEFTRVCGNLTGSHLSGAKTNPYGELEKFKVKVVCTAKEFKDFDLIKMDIEGQEADVFCSADPKCFEHLDIMMEINGSENALKIYQYSQEHQINLFIQNKSWKKANSLSDLPISHRDGSVFASKKTFMPW